MGASANGIDIQAIVVWVGVLGSSLWMKGTAGIDIYGRRILWLFNGYTHRISHDHAS